MPELDANGNPIVTPPPQPTPPPPGQTLLSGEDIPEAFRGKSAKEVVDSLLANATELERIKSENEAAKKEAEAVKAELEKIRTGGRLPTEEELKAEREKKLWQDPTTYVDQQVAKRLEPLTQTYYQDQANLQKTLARKSLPNFDKLEKRIDEYLSKVPLEMRAQPQTIEGAWKLARLDDLDQREKEFYAKSGYHVEAGGGPPPEPKPGKPTLSDDEKAVAKKYGMSDDDYAKWKENIYGD